jgi:hypothetical protein
MDVQITPARVTQTVKELNQMLGNKGLNYVEVIVALTEMAGRAVVMAAENSVQAKELAGIAFSHLSKTITIGMQAQKESVIERL